MTFTEPSVPSSQGLFQTMIDTFGTAGTIGIAIIGGAIALGVVIVLGRWGWAMFKRWLASTK